MRKLKLFLITLLLSVSVMVLAKDLGNPAGAGGGTGAPLDGGLLALLAAGGVTYYLGRKKKEK
jgi:hypothetical protein